MNRLNFFLLSAFWLLMGASACSNGSYPYQRVEGDVLHTRIYTLDNGLKVYLSVNQDAPRIQTYIAVRVGSKHDPAETTGLAHYFEHMMFKGTSEFGTTDWAREAPMIQAIEELFEQYREQKDPDRRAALYAQIDSLSYEASKLAIPNEYGKLMNALGSIGTNAVTSYDYTYYIENIPSNQLENWARIQSRRFSDPVLRLFHTELEAVYEEKNMSLTNDMRLVSEAINKGLFPHHPYGQQTTLGEAEHLKNPSMKNIREFFSRYYVPSNMGIVMSGDLDYDQTIALIDHHFGKLEGPAPEPLEVAPEEPIEKPVEIEVNGQQSELVQLAWRFGGARSEDALYIELISSILFNGKTGLIDKNLNQKMRSRVSGASTTTMADYSILNIMGRNKKDQSLEQVKDLLLGQVEQLKQGAFEEWMIEAAINNLKTTHSRRSESMQNAAKDIAHSFLMEVPWEERVNYIARLETITKEDLISFARTHLKDNYTVVYKRQGKPQSVELVEKPPISPIHINRDSKSAFFRNIEASQVPDIEPVFIDFEQAMDTDRTPGEPSYYVVQNEDIPTFSLNFNYPTGSSHDQRLGYAASYIKHLGTAQYTPQQISEMFYRLACSFNIMVRRDYTRITLKGLAENMEEALALFEHLIWDAQGDPEILAGRLRLDKRSREANKTNQQILLSALENYAVYGPQNPTTMDLSNARIDALTSDELIALLQSLWQYEHEVLYYGPASLNEVQQTVNNHRRLARPLVAAPQAPHPVPLETTEDKVYFVHFDANQSYLQTCSRGVPFSAELQPLVTLYNRYFGSGMQSIVFQELREKRGLAYSALSSYREPSHPQGYYLNTSYIVTQNDKVPDAFQAFDELFEELPLSAGGLALSKEKLLSNIRTERLTGELILFAHQKASQMGYKNDEREAMYKGLQPLDINDIQAFSREHISGRPKTYMILGHRDQIDFEAIEAQFGPVTEVQPDELFPR